MFAPLIRLWHWWWGLFVPKNIFVWFVGAIIGSGLMLTLNKRPEAVTVSTQRETNGIVSATGRINVMFELDRTRNCETETLRYLWKMVADPDDATKQVTLVVPLEAPPVPINLGEGRHKFIISLPVPTGISTGDKWFYSSSNTRNCPWFRVFDRPPALKSVPVPITVINGNEPPDVMP